MPDKAHAETDRQIAALERRIVKLYASAEKTLQERVAAYFRQLEAADKRQRERLEEGEITQQDYKQWRLAQIGRGKAFEKLVDDVSQTMTKANEDATEQAAEAMPDTYITNHNQETSEINNEEGVNLPLLTIAAATLLLKKNRPSVNKKKALAWNRKKFVAVVTSNILMDKPLMGEKGICVESLSFIVKRNESASRATARTLMTTIETMARQHAYDAADAAGIHRVKTWYTVHDNRVRDAHAAMDGISVPWTENFIVDGYEMIGPGDQRAPAYLRYNCRCRMKSERRPK